MPNLPKAVRDAFLPNSLAQRCSIMASDFNSLSQGGHTVVPRKGEEEKKELSMTGLMGVERNLPWERVQLTTRIKVVKGLLEFLKGDLKIKKKTPKAHNLKL